MSQSNSHFQEESRFSGLYSKQVFQVLYWSYRAYWLRILLTLVLGFFSRLLLFSNTQVMSWWADKLLNENHRLPGFMQTWEVPQFVNALLVLTVAGFSLTLFWRILFARTSARAVSQIHDEVVCRVSRFPMTFFEKNPVGRVVTRFSSDYGNIFRMFGGPLAEFITICFDVTVCLLLATYAFKPFMLIGGIMFLGFWMLYSKNKTNLRSARREVSRERSPSIAHFSESNQGATLLRIYSRVEPFKNRFLELDQSYQRARLNNSKISLRYVLQIYLFTGAVFLGFGLPSKDLMDLGWLSAGALGAVLTYVLLLAQNLQSFFDWLSQFEDALSGVERLNEYIRLPLEDGARLPKETQFVTDHPKPTNDPMTSPWKTMVGAKIEVNNLEFSYPGNKTLIKKLNFKILEGERIGMIGKTGSGKSTLAQLLFHVYTPTSGTVRVNDFQVWSDLKTPKQNNQMDLELFRQAFTWITQDPILFRGNLKDNLEILMGPTQLNHKRLLDLGLGPIMEHFPLGLDTPVEEKGRNLSAGERQLICLMRAALQSSPVLLMDEATSSVDTQSEKLVMDACDTLFKGRTQIIIAHRLQTIKSCHRILWLDDGQIKMFGRPQEILPQWQQHNHQAM